MGVAACVDTHPLWIFSECRTFAYVTVKDRMPRILTQVIDTVHKEEGRMKEQYGEVSYVSISSPIYRNLPTCV